MVFSSFFMEPYVAKQIPAKTKAESKRLTDIEQARLKKVRDGNLTAEIKKICDNAMLQGDRQVFKTEKEFKEAGFRILKGYNATDSEKKWFLNVVASKRFPLK